MVLIAMKVDKMRIAGSLVEIGSMRREYASSFRFPHSTISPSRANTALQGAVGYRGARNEPAGPRKGQFFLISAITIVVVLYGLSDLLKMQFIDATGVQSSTLPGIAMALEDNLNATAVSSPPEYLANNLDELIAFERKYLEGEGYALDISYNITAVPKNATIVLTSSGVYYEKNLVLG